MFFGDVEMIFRQNPVAGVCPEKVQTGDIDVGGAIVCQSPFVDDFDHVLQLSQCECGCVF